MNRDISAFKEVFENIPIPPELDRCIKLAIRKGRRARNQGRLFKFLAAAIIFLFFGFTLCVNLSPAFAAYIADMGLDSLVKLFSFDQGLANIVRRGFGKLSSPSATDKGITVTVESAIYDGRKLILAIRIDSHRELESVWLKDLRLRHVSGNMTSRSFPDAGESSRVHWQFLEYDLNGSTLPDKLFFECTEIEISNSSPEENGREMLTGNWSIVFSLEDRKLQEYKPVEVTVNKTAAMGEVRFTIESMAIYPTAIDVKISLDPNNPVRIAGFNNPRLIDGEGHEYTFKKFSGKNGILSFESAYFAGARDLTLALDGIYTLPLSETYFIIDIDNETVLDDGGYGIEFLGKTGEGEYLQVWFKPTDEEYETADNKFLWIEHRVHDLSGKPYDITFISTCVNGSKQYALGFDVSKGVPAAVKVKITGISKGIMKPLRIKLN